MDDGLQDEHSSSATADAALSPQLEVGLSGQFGAFSLNAEFTAPLRGVTALFGPSGSGKTTVLRGLAGLGPTAGSGLGRTSGRVRLGADLWQDTANGHFMPPHERRVGYVFQDAALFAHLDVANNLRFGQRRAPPATGATHDFDRLVELLGLAHLLRRAVTHLSGGEKQRVAIGRALLTQPKLLLLDEPLSAVDRATKDEILPYLERLATMFDVPVLYVSHDIGEVSRLADRLVLMSRGRVTAEGPLQDILARLDLNPDTGRFEAGVVLTARVTSHNVNYQVSELDFEGQVLIVPGTDMAIGARARLRVRARDVAIATERPRGISMRNVLAGTIESVVAEPETAYAETLIAVGAARLRARLTRQSVDELALQPGKPVFALIKSIAFDGRSVLAPELINTAFETEK